MRRMTEEYQARVDMNFRNPGGESALRQGERKHPCPTCGRENMLTDEDKRRGYQCDVCAARDEGRLGEGGEIF